MIMGTCGELALVKGMDPELTTETGEKAEGFVYIQSVILKPPGSVISSHQFMSSLPIHYSTPFQ